MYYENFDLTSVVTPVDADKLEDLLVKTHFDPKERQFIVNGFRNGFDLGFEGDVDRDKIKYLSPNLKLRVGSQVSLWNKIMKEVKLKRYAGPFAEPPYEYFIQSPVGLVPKDGGRDTRLIFHLSYPRDGSRKSVNQCTPKHLCKVTYADFAEAIKLCTNAGKGCKIGKSDMQSAFRNLGLLPKQYKILLLKAVSPFDGRTYFFVDKCLPFGHCISCNLFQRVSDCIAHIVQYRNRGDRPVNYLDDFLFAALLKSWCNQQISNFLQVCAEIKFPVSLSKTYWGTDILVFLGLLINTVEQMVSIPAEKIDRANQLVNELLSSKKTTVYKLQKLTGFLNFLCRAIVPGRAFTRRLYSYFSSSMKKHFHVNVNSEMKSDLRVWKTFLENPNVFCRPFMDFGSILLAQELDWYTDASGSIGMGGYHKDEFFLQEWDPTFLEQYEPTIQYKELYAVTVSVYMWGHRYQNRRIRLFCDNENVVRILNTSTSGCKNCMVLVRLLVAKCLQLNLRVFGKFVSTKDNNLADALSRFQLKRFWREVLKQKRTMKPIPVPVLQELWPMDKVWSPY